MPGGIFLFWFFRFIEIRLSKDHQAKDTTEWPEQIVKQEHVKHNHGAPTTRTRWRECIANDLLNQKRKTIKPNK